MNQATLMNAHDAATSATREGADTMLKAIEERLHPARRRVDAIVGQARGLVAVAGEKAAPLTRAIRAQIDARRPQLDRLGRWLTTVGLNYRPVQLVSVALVVGALYVAAWDPFAKPLPDAPEVVAARTAPIGTVNLLPAAPEQQTQQNPASGAAN